MTIRRGRLGAGRLGAADYAPGLEAPGLLGAETFRRQRQEKIFFPKKVFFSKTGFLPKKIFFSNDSLFSNKNFFEKKNFFQQTSFALIKMLIFSKLFISCLSRRIVRIESAGKGMAIGKSRTVIGWKRIAERASLCTTFKLYKNSFVS